MFYEFLKNIFLLDKILKICYNSKAENLNQIEVHRNEQKRNG